MDYTGSPVPEEKLPEVIVNTSDGADTAPSYYYQYKKPEESAYTTGLPTNAGTYEIVATLPETPSSHAVSTEPVTLIINKIEPVLEAPKAEVLTYDGTAQKLVTAGRVRDGAVIEFAQSAGGPYSEDIPTGVNAWETYRVWYRVEETENYKAVPETEIQGVQIQRKTITPTVELSFYTCLYDGGDKEPAVTVKDGETVLPGAEYEVTYSNNRDVGTAAVDVTDKANGNYAVTATTVNFEITKKIQDTLSITNKPDTVTYGDQFTLSTLGGSDNGEVTWKITDGAGIARVDANSGQVTVTGVGSATVQATKSGTNNGAANYEDAIAVWKFDTVKKTVAATVTAEDKTYNGTTEATVHAEVKDGVVAGDKITITGLEGAFQDKNAGTNKTVVVDTAKAVISGANWDRYIVTYSSLAVTANINKAAASVVTPPADKASPYSGSPQDLITAGTANNTETPLEYALSESGPYSIAIPQKTDAGSYEVWYRVRETQNYTGTDAVRMSATIAKKQVAPVVTVDQGSYVYDGSPKRPDVTVKEADGSLIPDSEYTVAYSNNINEGTATVTVTARAGGNYQFSGPATANFTIGKAEAKLISPPLAKDLTYNKNEQDLVTGGTAAGGKVVYSETGADGSYVASIPHKAGAGTYPVYYKVEGDGNHEDTSPSLVYVTIKPMEITAAITLDTTTSRVYSGGPITPGVTVKNGSDTIGAEEYHVSYRSNTNAGTATVIVSNANSGNYIVNGTIDFEITKADPTFTPPSPITGLQYTGAAQELIARGSAAGGKMVYSLDGTNYSEAAPTGLAVQSYPVYYKVLGDDNHNDLTPASNSVTAAIGKNIVNTPTITLSSDTFRYDGGQHKPTITVRDDKGLLIPENEYEVTIAGTNGNDSMVSVDTYTVTVTTPGTSNNYDIRGTANTRTFAIVNADQEILSITNTRGQVYYGDVIQLGTAGGTGDGTVTWSITGNTASTLSPDGLLTVKDFGGPITVTAERTSDNYSKISTTWEFSAGKKPVTAVLTGVDKVYDSGVAAKVKAEVAPGDLVSGDSIQIDDLDGTFDNANVGTNKRITITTSTPTVSGTNADKYEVTYLSTAAASITPAEAAAAAPTPASPLTYKAGEAQALLTAGTGSATGGTLVYSLDGSTFSQAIPTGTNAGTYTVYYKAQGDGNHTDSPAGTVQAAIAKQPVTPIVQLTPPTATYDGSVKQPAVTLRDSTNHVIPESEYTVTYDPGTNWKDKGGHTVRIADFSGGNYVVDSTTTATFTISEAESNPLEIAGKPGLVYYGDHFTLSAVGGSGNGAVTWESSDDGIASVDRNTGLVTVTGVGAVTITATKEATLNYEESKADYSLTVLKRPVTGTVAADDKVFDNTTVATIHVTWESGGLAGNDSIGVTGAFVDENAGTGKTVNLTVTSGSDKYEITIPSTVTASILKANAVLATTPGKISGLTFDGTDQELVSPGSTVDGIGVVEYRLGENGEYSAGIPTANNAGTYTVWYRVEGTGNYEGIGPVSIGEVKIEKAEPTFDPYPTAAPFTSGQKLRDISLSGGIAKFDTVTVSGSFDWADGDTEAVDGTAYDVIFTPDSTNYQAVTFQVTVTAATAAPGNGSDSTGSTTSPSYSPSASAPNAASAPSQAGAPMETTVQDGTATTIVSAAGAEQLVKDAVENQSENVVIKPEITEDVTKAEVSIPAPALSLLGSETDADLIVSTPIADVTIPNAALDTLSSAGGMVTVVTEREENTVTLTLTADGKIVENVPGGLTLTVPAEDAGPGTVAVLVHEDGTRETIRKSVVKDSSLIVPLNGSAAIEIVDNSREFADVPAGNWAADAVAFASAHELFSGTSETAFSPDQPMSRAMLAVVLYNLESCPAQSLTDEFSDAGGDDWYAAGVSWAAENGITNGYGDGLFGPDDNVTREQFAVMLWKYAGSPSVSGQDLDFTDADQVSSYAAEALRWAAANGILSGYGDGRLDPGGLATRAQAAQMLKNFMENV